MRPRSLLLLSALALGCGNDTTGPIAYCTAPASIAVIVAVDDSVTGSSIADGARGIAQAGAVTDTLRFFAQPPRLVGGTERGIYRVTIDHPGYREWIRSGIFVSEQGPCGNTIPVELIARLQPAD